MEQLAEVIERTKSYYFGKKLKKEVEELKSEEDSFLLQNGWVTPDFVNKTLIAWGAVKQGRGTGQRRIVAYIGPKLVQKSLTNFESYFPPSQLYKMHGIYAHRITDFF